MAGSINNVDNICRTPEMSSSHSLLGMDCQNIWSPIMDHMQFTSIEFEQFTSANGIRNIRSASYHPGLYLIQMVRWSDSSEQ